MATNPHQPDRDGESPNRRMVLRRRMGGGGGGFSSGSSSQAEGHPDDDEGYDDLNDIVRDRGPSRLPPPAPATPPPITPRAGGDDARRMLLEAQMAGDSNYAREFRLGLLHKLLLRQIPLNDIATQLGVSITTVQKDRVALKERLRQRARNLDINEIVGEQSAFYDEVQALSLRLSSIAETPAAMKLAALRTAMTANADRNRFLTASGVYDVLAFRRAESGEAVSDVQLLMSRTDELLDRLSSMPDTEESTPRRPPRTRVVRRAKEGFPAPTFADPTASNSDEEVVEL